MARLNLTTLYDLSPRFNDLNLTSFAHIERVSTTGEATDKLKAESFDLIILLLRVGADDVYNFIDETKTIAAGVPVLLLATTMAELQLNDPRVDQYGRVNVDKRRNWEQRATTGPNTNVWMWPFLWQGDVRLFLSMIKVVEDRLNTKNDCQVEEGIKVILLVEDNVQFYSSYLPMLYTEVVKQTQAVMGDSLTHMQKLMRQRARPKILLATSYEEAVDLYQLYHDNILTIICDAAFPRGGKHDLDAGISFTRMVRAENPTLPVVIQSQSISNAEKARAMSADFLHKGSATLLTDLRAFMLNKLGFGPFRFCLPNGTVVTEARTMSEFMAKLPTVPDMSIVFHAFNDDFATWLNTRGEFELAKYLKSRGSSDFNNVPDLRHFITKAVQSYREKAHSGVITQFSGTTWDGHTSRFSRIGYGSLGGKGRGLGFMFKAMAGKGVDEQFPGVHVRVPWTLAVTTAVFDEFMERNKLNQYALGGPETSHEGYDEVVTEAFLKAELPPYVVADIRAFCKKITVPLAIRSSSLFEDTFRQPFAGIYKTYFLPNNEDELEVRVSEICTAIKLIYASTFWKQAKAYMQTTSFRVEEMKMAVIIQEIAGRVHENRWIYPDLAGVARAYNFYPEEGARSEHGIALLALGLGSTVVDGSACSRVTPHCAAPPSTHKGKNTELQTSFTALDLSLRFREEASLIELPLRVAMSHNTFPPVGGVVRKNDPNRTVIPLPWQAPNSPPEAAAKKGEFAAPISLAQSVHGEQVEFAPEFQGGQVRGANPKQTHRLANGKLDLDQHDPVVCMEGVLQNKELDLRRLLGRLLEVGTEGFECPVEIEWAVNLAQNPGDIHELVLLQTRPMSMWKREAHVGIEPESLPDGEASLFSSTRALGNGAIGNIRDVVFVHPDDFPGVDQGSLVQVAKDIGHYNRILREEKRGFVLICPGRFGTRQEGKGIPVAWPDINGTKCIVETDIKGVNVPPSEGTHFFQNIASFGIGYVTVYSEGEGHVSYDWLRDHVSSKKGIVQHVSFDAPMEVVIDGMTGCAVGMKPGHDFTTVVAQASAYQAMNQGQYSSSL